MVENPISLLQALLAPFASVWQFVAGKFQSFLASARQKLASGAEKALEAPPGEQPAAAAPQGQGGGGMSGPMAVVAGVSVSIAALGSAFAFAVHSLAKAGPLPILYGFMAVFAIIFVPLIIRSVWRLRRQDLSVILEASGWAINHRMRLNRRLRRHFTLRKPYPAGAEGGPRRRWFRILLVVLLVIVLAMASFLAVGEIRAMLRARRGRTKEITPTSSPSHSANQEADAGERGPERTPTLPGQHLPEEN